MYCSCFIVLRSSMHNYTCDKTHVVLRKFPKAKDFCPLISQCLVSRAPMIKGTHSCQVQLQGWRSGLDFLMRGATKSYCKKSVYRDEKNVTPVLQSNTFYGHKERRGKILLNLAEDWQRRQWSIHLYLLDYYIKHSLPSYVIF